MRQKVLRKLSRGHLVVIHLRDEVSQKSNTSSKPLHQRSRGFLIAGCWIAFAAITSWGRVPQCGLAMESASLHLLEAL